MSNKFKFLKEHAGQAAQPAAKAAAPGLPATDKRPRGRPHAKRSDPDYLQVTSYIKRTTHQAAKMKLLRERLNNEGHGRDFSELIEDLVAVWARATRA